MEGEPPGGGRPHHCVFKPRQVNSTSAAQVFTAIGSNTEYLRELIRSVVREELQKAAAPPLPTVSSIASIIKDELHQALRDPVTLDNTTAVPTEYRRATYAEALKRPASSPPLFVRAPPTVSLQSAQQLQYSEDTRTSPFVYGVEIYAGEIIAGVAFSLRHAGERRWKLPCGSSSIIESFFFTSTLHVTQARTSPLSQM
ncbi:hypothetical protein HPB52_022610 [Rhipicephalus sanguineus]|uniref:Uncharacterized protein n=1 Tax=Rhipicephalus sanguineus TaxID=34632 RepID=A0A9D4T4L4_RHISA|nr:hypothetical protein HPB52_022610 [Rhipicephalus sanguineus]